MAEAPQMDLNATRIDATERDSLIATAREAADAARDVTRKYFRGGALETVSKLEGGFDPVTVADRAAETAMREIIARNRPEDGILGEEFGAEQGTSGLTWVLDPIDGTRGFVAGTPTWGVLIGLRNREAVLYGIVDQPYIGERFEGGFGVAEVNGPMGRTALVTRDTATLSDALIFSTFPEVGSAEEGAAFHELARHCKLTRYGMDCYAYALLAAGQIDLVVEAGLNSYDILGPLAVVEAAGGIVTNWKGGDAKEGGRIIAAANPQIHAAALEYLANA